MKKITPKIKLRFILWGLIFLALVFFLIRAVSPSGRLAGEYQPQGINFWGGQGIVGPLGPSDRLAWSDKSLRLIKSPAYFSVFSPREFKQATLTLTYRNLDVIQQKTIDAGVLLDEKLWRFDVLGIENLALENLMTSWERQDDGTQIILSNPSAESKLRSAWPRVATYQTDYQLYLAKVIKPFDVSGDYSWPKLRGDSQFLVLLNDQPLRFEFSFSDLNRNNQVGGDPIVVLIYDQNNQVVTSHEIEDPGGAVATEELIDRGGWQLYRSGLDPGWYRVEIRANDDIVSQVQTKNSLVALSGKAWLFEPATLFTSSPVLRSKTKNHNSLGEIIFADQKIILTKTDEIYKAATSVSGSRKILSARGDVFLEVAGELSLDSNFPFALRSQELSPDSNLAEIDMIRANYSPPRDLVDGWRQQTVTFDLNSAWRRQGFYKFMLSLPDLTTGVEIGSIKVELTGQSLGGKIKKIFKL